MRLNSLALRLFATSAAWTLLVLPLAGYIIYSLYREDVQLSFDAQLKKLLTQITIDSMSTTGDTPVMPPNLYEPLFEVTQSGWYWQIRPIDGQVVPVRGDYYLAGGRSNRDYPALVEAFRSLPARLVILCSQVNLEELGQVRIPIMSRSCATFLSRPSMYTFEVRKPASSPCGTIRVRPGRVWRSRSCETRNALWLPGPGD